MHFEGVVKKMTTEYSSVVNYFIEFENSFIHLNQFLEKLFTIECIGYSCLSCSSNQEIFRQGFCKSCFFESPLAGDWIIKPELSKAHLNIADRDLEYEKKIQLQPHIVYLSNTGSVKVGITRKSQIPHRWIDQGAHEAIEIIETPNSNLSSSNLEEFKNQIEEILNNRLENLTPVQVKKIIQDIIKSHLGWLVVWGGLLGGFIGFSLSVIQSL